MEFNYIADGIDAVVIDNFYTEEQLKDIMNELNWLNKPSILQDETQLTTAEQDGKLLSSKHGVFLENVFRDWRHSALISSSMKQTNCKQFKDGLLKNNTMFKSLFECNVRSHLLSYYENSNYYKPHTDAFFFTILNYFNVEPKKFIGGEIVLKSCISDKEATIEPMNNRTVVILSSTVHEVKEIKLDKSFNGLGRYCNSAFLTYKDPREMASQ
jgi:hypothetical protein